MDIFSAKIRLASILAGLAIAAIATGIILAVVRYVFGYSFSIAVVGIILLFVAVIDIAQWLFSPYMIGWMYHMTPLSTSDPSVQWIRESVEKVAALNNEKVPQVFIAEVNFPNAFAYGSPLTGKRMAITRGLLSTLNRDEIEAVIGHEIGHLKHHDAELLLAIGLIPMLVFYLGYALIFSGGRGRQNGSAFLVAIVLIVVSFVFNIIILGVNRLRETYADINAATTVQKGADNLQTALAKIAASTPSHRVRSRKTASGSVASMLMIYNPEEGVPTDHHILVEKWRHMKVPVSASLFSDHPHPAKRIQVLERYRHP
ncbi:MAG: zinc metalloprotease HtpX [Candidatus Thermoplasmatota archaeon]|nr:zinc metalloprotease HtpX [Candidatus Thermoplasmatota archaeon]